jgi:glycosyltransferase involved in cell wall biosynthesis
MNIGFDAKRLFNNFTGLGNYSRFVVRALTEYFPDNQYVLYSPRVKSNADTEYFLSAKNAQIEIPTGLSKIVSSVWRSYCLGNVAFDNGATIFHGLSNELPVTKPQGLKTIVTIHDVIFKRYPEFYNAIDRVIYTRKFKTACSSADVIVAVSQQTANDAIEFLNADPSKIRVIYQGCHPSFKAKYSQDQISQIKKKYGLPDEFILNVGTIESRKNALLILKALRSIKDKIQLVIVGKPTAYKDELVEYIQTHNLSSQVTFVHHADFRDLPLIYQAATAFIYPSLFEGFGIPIVEAINSGIPVITSSGSCFSEAGGPDCWYVDPHDAEELAAAIQSVVSDKDSVKIRVGKSEDYVKQFEPKVIAEGLMSVYQQLA